MHRLSPLLLALGFIVCLLATPALTPQATAGDAAAENSRRYRYIERYPGFVGKVTATASANAPIFCNFRMTWTTDLQKFAVIANCQIAPGSRNGQRVIINGNISDRITGEREMVISRCRDIQSSDPDSGKVTLRCELPIPQVAADTASRDETPRRATR